MALGRTGIRMMALALMAALAGPGLAEDGVKSLRIGVEGAYPPFNYKTAGGTLAGFDIDIARALCGRLKVTCVFVTETWDNLIPALRS
ncbi:MAG TPA: transporter substrate-binding domain-containing protein, partial [Thermopetrobacter sp.]|nr:transporter substrate-binding domain-containing protein [Thermopetrobacter sp.]